MDTRYIKKRRKLNILLERGFMFMLDFWRRPKKVPAAEEVRAILVIRHNQLGDAVAASPFIEAIKEIWPNARVDVLASKVNQEAFSWVHGVGDIHVLPEDGSFSQRRRFLNELAGKYDIVFQTLFDESYISRAWMARKIAGPGLAVGRTRGSPVDGLYDKAVGIPAGGYVGKLMALLTPFTELSVAELIARHPAHVLTIPEKFTQSATQKLALCGLRPQGYIALNISARVDFRNLGVTQAARIANWLRSRGLAVVLLSAPDDRARAQEVKALAPDVVLSQAASLGEAMAMAQLARLYLGADTGVAHFAAAGQVPCLVLFANQARADIWSPYGVPFVAIQANPDQAVTDLDDALIFEYTNRLLAGDRLTRIVRSTAPFFSMGPERAKQPRRAELG